MFARAVNIDSAPSRFGLGDVYAAMLALKHSIIVLGNVGGGRPGGRLLIECVFDISDDEPEGEKDKNKT